MNLGSVLPRISLSASNIVTRSHHGSLPCGFCRKAFLPPFLEIVIVDGRFLRFLAVGEHHLILLVSAWLSLFRLYEIPKDHYIRHCMRSCHPSVVCANYLFRKLQFLHRRRFKWTGRLVYGVGKQQSDCHHRNWDKHFQRCRTFQSSIRQLAGAANCQLVLGKQQHRYYLHGFGA